MDRKYIVLVNGVKMTETLTAKKAKRLSDAYNHDGISSSFARKLPNTVVEPANAMNVFKWLNSNGGKR